jgi:uncharacterized membrane protein
MEDIHTVLNLSSLAVFVLGLIAAVVAWYRPTQRSQALSYFVFGVMVVAATQIARIMIA